MSKVQKRVLKQITPPLLGFEGEGFESRKEVGQMLWKDKNAFTQALGNWFLEHGRSLPWRDTRDPYAILVSELMLQQTQVATVLGKGYYARWMKHFPTMEVLAKATEADVLACWQGLGYYRRARSLHQAAKMLMTQFRGVFPKDMESILSLPGVGKYTAGAVASFAFNQPLPIVDGNVQRVLARLMNYDQSVASGEGLRQIWTWAEALVPDHAFEKETGIGPRVFNSAIMELGQRVCVPKKPACDVCPVSAWCLARYPETLPVLPPRKESVEVEEVSFWLQKGEKLWLKIETGSRRQGLWRLPTLFSTWDKSSGGENCSWKEKTAHWPLLLQLKYALTHHRVQFVVREAPESFSPEKEGFEGAWHEVKDLEDLPMPSPDRKALIRLLKPTKLEP